MSRLLAARIEQFALPSPRKRDMPPKPCPPYMRRLLTRLNQLPPNEPNPLKHLLKALKEKKHGKGGDTVTVKSASEVTVNFVNLRVAVRSDLELALQDVGDDLPNLVVLIRECPEATCGQLFWAGRSDKKACDKHTGLLRKRRNRRDIKNREKQKKADAKAEAKRVEAERRRESATKTLNEMNPTARSVIHVIMVNGARSFGRIDVESSRRLWDIGDRSRSTKVVRNVTHSLYKDEYLEYFESADHRRADRYYPTQKLRDLWADSQQEKS